MSDTPSLPDGGPPSFSSEPTLVPGGARSPSAPPRDPGARRPAEPQSIWLDDFSVDSRPTQRPGSVSGAIGRIDQYEIMRKLGGGGFGVVYLARDTVGKVDVALKTLHPLLKQNPEEMEELASQFALVSRLAHPNIASPLVLHPCRSVEIWNDEARKELRLSPGDPVMVMRYAPGVTLSKWRRQFPGRVVPLPLALEVGRQVAAALDYAHSERIVHRDVKPGNIMVETLGADRDEGGASRPGEPQSLRVRILDFGLAAEIRSSMSRVSSESGDTSGTRPYMAPEQWLGRKQDGRTDQYALACVLYELLSGAPPFAGVFETGDPAIMMQRVTTGDPDALEDVPDSVNEAFARALAKDPKVRFPSCAAFVAALGGGAEPLTQNRGESGDAETASHAENAEGAERSGGASRLGEPQRQAVLERAAREKAERLRAARGEEARRNQVLRESETRRNRRGCALGAAIVAVVVGIFIWGASQESTPESPPVTPPTTQQPVVSGGSAGRSVQTESHAAGDRFVPSISGISVPMRWCPATTSEEWRRISGGKDFFTMGSPSGEDGRYDDETQHRVTLTKGFWLGETEVTQGLWKEVMGRNPSYNPSGDSYPVENVSWDDCQDFLRKLNAKSPKDWRFALPTEAQWEYACRAGSPGPFAGTGRLDDMGWYDGNSGDKTHSVAQKRANAWGLHDMHGNVWEWCADWFGPYPDGAVTDPGGPASGDGRVLRGGSSWGGARGCRSAGRIRDDPDFRFGFDGLRLLAFQDGK